MKIVLVKPYGYCAGVDHAIALAKSTKDKNKDKNVVVLGMLVHNNDALKELETYGIYTLYKKDKTLLELIDEIKPNSIVILTAHGHSKEVENKLNTLGIPFVDATCPFVTMTHHKIVETVNKGQGVAYIGKENHPEANAALSISSKVQLIDLENPNLTLNDPDSLIVNQTTFSNYEIENVIKEIKNKYPNATAFKSVCDASTKRQEALLSLDKETQLIYIVGGSNSNNTKTLLKMAKEKYPKALVLAIQNKDDINKRDLIGLSNIAICSGASTPSQISEEVKTTIESLLN